MTRHIIFIVVFAIALVWKVSSIIKERKKSGTADAEERNSASESFLEILLYLGVLVNHIVELCS